MENDDILSDDFHQKKKYINFLIKAKINRYSCKIFWQQKIARLGLDEISTFVEGKVVKIFFGFTMLTQKNVQFILARLLLYQVSHLHIFRKK